jgi:hypothetical protein
LSYFVPWDENIKKSLLLQKIDLLELFCIVPFYFWYRVKQKLTIEGGTKKEFPIE